MGTNLVPEQRVDKNGRLVTRHVRQDASGAPNSGFPSPSLPPADSELQIAAEAIIDAIKSEWVVESYRDAERDKRAAAMMVLIFPEETIRHASEIVGSNNNPEVTIWMLKGLSECATEAAVSGDGITKAELTIPNVITKVEQARVFNACSGYEFPYGNAGQLLSKLESHVIAALRNAAREGRYSSGGDIDADQHKASVSLLMLNVINPDITTRDVSEEPDMASHLFRMYDEMDRILPHLKEFQKRGSFDFDLLAEIENSTTPALNDGLL